MIFEKFITTRLRHTWSQITPDFLLPEAPVSCLARSQSLLRYGISAKIMLYFDSDYHSI